MELSDVRHQRLLDWEMTPVAERSPSSQVLLAKELGVSTRSLRDWKATPAFQEAWRAAFQVTAGSKERLKVLLDTLYEDATVGPLEKRVQSAKLYWEISRQIAPPEPELVASRHASSLSDAELSDMLSDAALGVLQDRGVVDG